MKRILILALAGVCLGTGLAGSLHPAWGQADQGKSLFEAKCVLCHGSDGKGNGPAAAALSPSPTDFTNPGFWQGNVNRLIADTIENGKGPMPALDLDPGQIKAVIDYMSHTFK
jgi:mono/diheme cytochrome c family protein